MKLFLYRACIVVVVAIIMAPSLVSGALVIYKGKHKDSHVGDHLSLVVNWRKVLVIELETSRVANLQYAVVNGTKHYFTSVRTNLHSVQAEGSRTTNTVIAYLPSECEIQNGSTGEGVYCRGVNSSLSIAPGMTVAYPKILTDCGNGLSFARGPINPVVTDGSFQVVFDRPGTIASNQAHETLEQALARWVAHVEALGYTR